MNRLTAPQSGAQLRQLIYGIPYPVRTPIRASDVFRKHRGGQVLDHVSHAEVFVTLDYLHNAAPEFGRRITPVYALAAFVRAKFSVAPAAGGQRRRA
jgi:hypothetical protein